MSDSTTQIQQVSQSAIQRELQINANFDAAAPSQLFARLATSAALTWAYQGGRFNGTQFANGTVALTASNTNYVVAHKTTLAVTASTATTNWNDATNYGRCYLVVAGASAVTSYEDHRAGALGILESGAGGGSTSPGGSDTYVQYNDSSAFGGDARLAFNETTKVLTGQFAVDSNAINAQTGTSYTLVAADNGKLITLSNASPITLTVPTSLGVGFSCMLEQLGAGVVTITPSSTTVESLGGLLDTAGQYAVVSLIARAANTFVAGGALA